MWHGCSGAEPQTTSALTPTLPLTPLPRRSFRSFRIQRPKALASQQQQRKVGPAINYRKTNLVQRSTDQDTNSSKIQTDQDTNSSKTQTDQDKNVNPKPVANTHSPSSSVFSPSNLNSCAPVVWQLRKGKPPLHSSSQLLSPGFFLPVQLVP